MDVYRPYVFLIASWKQASMQDMDMYMNDQPLRLDKAKQLRLKTTPFFSREKEELPQAGLEPATCTCTVGEKNEAQMSCTCADTPMQSCPVMQSGINTVILSCSHSCAIMKPHLNIRVPVYGTHSYTQYLYSQYDMCRHKCMM